jgi:hypothetical protein
MRALILTILMVCVCTHLSELFDTWDRTLETGNDTEVSVAIVALCVGAAFIVIRLLRALFRNCVVGISPCKFGQTPTHILRPVLALLSATSPPLRV